MATIIPSSGSISASYLETYIGGRAATGANTKLSYPLVVNGNNTTPTGSNLSLNQIFNARYPNNINTWTGYQSMSAFRGKCFGIYTSSMRTTQHGSTYNDFFSGFFSGYFGFGTSTSGRSGVLNTINQGFPIGIRISTLSGSAFGLRVRAYNSSGVWTTLPFSTPVFEIIGNYSAITIDAQTGYFYELYLQVWPAKNSDTLASGNGVHSISLRLEEPQIDESSSSDPFGPPKFEPIRR